MSVAIAPISQQIWDMKYRLKAADGEALDGTVEDSWRRVFPERKQIKIARLITTEF